MFLNLNDPDSIVTWWREFPERHDAYLDFIAQRSPQFGAAIRQARRQMRSDPALRALLEQAEASRQVRDMNDIEDSFQSSSSAYLEMAH